MDELQSDGQKNGIFKNQKAHGSVDRKIKYLKTIITCTSDGKYIDILIFIEILNKLLDIWIII